MAEDDAGWQEVARYVHPNPVRVGRLKLDKSGRAAPRAGPACGPTLEQQSLRGGATAATWAQMVTDLERAKGESWTSFANRHGGWGHDAALWLGRRAGRLRSAQLGKLAGSLDYAVVSKAIARFGRRLALDVPLSEQLTAIQNQLPK